MSRCDPSFIVSAAVLAFTGTFSTGDRLSSGPIGLLFASWALLVFAIAAALYSVGRLTSFLRFGGDRDRACVRSANLSYFALFAAVLVFFVFAIWATTKKDANLESARAMQVAVAYIKQVSPDSTQPAGVREIAWNASARVWVIRIQTDSSSIAITVDPREMKVIRFVK